MNFLTYIIIGITVSGLLSYMRKPKEPKGNTVTLPALMAVIGVVGIIGFTVLALLTYEDEGILTAVVLLLFVLLSASLVVAYLNCRISYDETSFTVKNFWGITRTYTYGDITWRKGQRDVTLYVGDRVVRIDELSVGKTEFLCFAEARYRKTHGGRAIPVKSPDGKGFDLFNGNVENPAEFILAYAVMLGLVLFMFGFLAYESLPIKAESLSYVAIQIEDYEVMEESLYLYAEGENLPFRIRGYVTALENPDAFLRRCEDKPSFAVGCLTYESADEPDHALHYVEDEGGMVWLTLEAAYKEHLMYMKEVALLMCGMALVLILFIVGSIYVGRHPERFSPRFVRLFFKEGYIRMPAVPKNKKR